MEKGNTNITIKRGFGKSRKQMMENDSEDLDKTSRKITKSSTTNFRRIIK